MEEFINNPVNVQSVIMVLNINFPGLLKKYAGYDRDAVSFYLYGHCTSFARILYEIFNGNCAIYDDFSSESENREGHVICKIGDHFYDVRGCIDQTPTLENYKECPISRFPFIEDMHGNSTDHDEEIKEELIAIGKKAIEALYVTDGRSR